MNFDGYAVGGLAVGEKQTEMFTVLDELKDVLPEENHIIWMV